MNYVQLLANVGFGDDGALQPRVDAWRHLFLMAAPDLIVFDHAPTALLASRRLPSGPRRVVIGSGFCCPPDDADGEGDTGWGVFASDAFAHSDAPRLRAEAEEILGRVNRVLAHWALPPIPTLRCLYSEVDETFLTTFPELDHFPKRPGPAYWGPVIHESADSVGLPWPGGGGKRVFAYLKPSRETGQVLQALEDAGCATVAFVPQIPVEARRKFESPTLRFVDRPVNLRTAGRECDLAVLNGGHGATAEMLLAGKPILQVPVMLEQCMTADAVGEMGAGESAPALPGKAWQGHAKLNCMLNSGRYAEAACRFAARYASFDPARQRRKMFEHAVGLCSSPPPGLAQGTRRAVGFLCTPPPQAAHT